jgi:hypothetical protein
MSRIAITGMVTAPSIEQGQIVGPFVVIGTVATATLTTDNLYIEFDTGLIPDTNTLELALNNAFTFLQSSGSITVD